MNFDIILQYLQRIEVQIALAVLIVFIISSLNDNDCPEIKKTTSY